MGITLKIKKYIIKSALTVMVTLSIMMVTILYAYQYTTSHEASNNSFQNGNGGLSQGQFQKNYGGNQNGGPSSGDSQKIKN